MQPTSLPQLPGQALSHGAKRPTSARSRRRRGLNVRVNLNAADAGAGERARGRLGADRGPGRTCSGATTPRGRRWRRDASNAAWLLEEVYARDRRPGRHRRRRRRLRRRLALAQRRRPSGSGSAPTRRPAPPSGTPTRARPPQPGQGPAADRQQRRRSGQRHRHRRRAPASPTRACRSPWPRRSPSGSTPPGRPATATAAWTPAARAISSLVLGLADRQGRRHRRRAVLARGDRADHAQRLRLQAPARLDAAPMPAATSSPFTQDGDTLPLASPRQDAAGATHRRPRRAAHAQRPAAGHSPS